MTFLMVVAISCHASIWGALWTTIAALAVPHNHCAGCSYTCAVFFAEVGCTLLECIAPIECEVNISKYPPEIKIGLVV